jgi:hypothetical protein
MLCYVAQMTSGLDNQITSLGIDPLGLLAIVAERRLPTLYNAPSKPLVLYGGTAVCNGSKR